MTRINSLLRDLTSELSGTKIQNHKGVQTHLRKMVATQNGGLQLVMQNGDQTVVPILGKFLTEGLLSMMIRVTRCMVKKGIIGKVTNIFRFISFFMILVAIASVVVIVAGTKFLIDSVRCQL
jgi:hypothetical protein